MMILTAREILRRRRRDDDIIMADEGRQRCSYALVNHPPRLKTSVCAVLIIMGIQQYVRRVRIAVELGGEGGERDDVECQCLHRCL